MTKIRPPHEMLTDNMIVKHLAGSKSYGTNLPTSDTDIRGVFCADSIHARSPWFTVNEISIPEDEDTKFYELVKFMTLLVDQNPNIVETLWVDEEHILESSPAYDYLREHRQDLLSSKVAFTYSGYAMSQLKRIKGHNKWLNNPQPEQPPRQIDYISLVQDFTSTKRFKFTGEDMIEHQTDMMLIPYGNNIFGMYDSKGSHCDLFSNDFTLNTVFEGDVEQHGSPIRIIKYNIEEYKLAKNSHKQYWEWKKNRNEMRSELEQKFGYDSKHAMHLVRLLRMGKEILTEGVVHVLRPDATELLDIRDGCWEYDELLEYATSLDTEIRNVYYKESKLRSRVDLTVATKLLCDTQDIVWYGGR